MRYGTNHEKDAISSLATNLGMHINDCGIFVHSKYGFLAANPDGIVGEDRIVEVKCPKTFLPFFRTFLFVFLYTKIYYMSCIYKESLNYINNLYIFLSNDIDGRTKLPYGALFLRTYVLTYLLNMHQHY
uniref:Exonuclease n=1 Tax=Lygus hesperus TaxID=30085 RepID=A0A0A9YDP4_LYGHE